MSETYTYSPSVDADLLVANWWAEMHASGDLERVFVGAHQPLSGFFALMREYELRVRVASDGIWAAAWFQPFAAGSFCGIWVRASMRATRSALDFMDSEQRRALDSNPALFAITRHPRVVRTFARFGWDMLSSFDVDGSRAWLISVTRDTYAPFDARVRRVLDRTRRIA